MEYAKRFGNQSRKILLNPQESAEAIVRQYGTPESGRAEPKGEKEPMRSYDEHDSVNHNILMARVVRKVRDKFVLRLIRAYLNAGVIVNGVVRETEEGTPQGGPLRPLLANILLDDLVFSAKQEAEGKIHPSLKCCKK